MIFRLYQVQAVAPNPHATGDRDTLVYSTFTLPDFVYNSYEALAIDGLIRFEMRTMQETLVNEYWVDVHDIHWEASLSMPIDTKEALQ
jgi:hypothetical protein